MTYEDIEVNSRLKCFYLKGSAMCPIGAGVMSGAMGKDGLPKPKVLKDGRVIPPTPQQQVHTFPLPFRRHIVKLCPILTIDLCPNIKQILFQIFTVPNSFFFQPKLHKMLRLLHIKMKNYGIEILKSWHIVPSSRRKTIWIIWYFNNTNMFIHFYNFTKQNVKLLGKP